MKVKDTIVLEFKVPETISQEEILEALEYFVILSFKVKSRDVLNYKSKISLLKKIFKHKFIDGLNHSFSRRNVRKKLSLHKTIFKNTDEANLNYVYINSKQKEKTIGHSNNFLEFIFHKISFL